MKNNAMNEMMQMQRKVKCKKKKKLQINHEAALHHFEA
jgi:hypothetical protein